MEHDPVVRLFCIDGPLVGSRLPTMGDPPVPAEIRIIKGAKDDSGFWDEHDYVATGERGQHGAYLMRYTGDSWGMPR